MPKTVHPGVQSSFTLIVKSAQRFDVKKTMAYVGGAARAPVAPNRQYIDYRYNERVTGLTRAGYMIWVKGAALKGLPFVQAAAREKNNEMMQKIYRYEMDRSQS
ncbi:MAG: hypothetical protein WAU34_04400 [Desulfobacterales bacterium]